MSYCTSCGKENIDGNRFCTGCGKALNTEEKKAVVEEKQEIEESLKISSNPKENQPIMKKTNKNGKGLKIGLIIAVLLCICLCTGIVARGYIIKRNPVSRLFNGISKLSSSKTLYSTSTFRMKFEGNNSNEETKLLEKMSLRITRKADSKGKDSFNDLEILYNEQCLVRGKVYTDEKGITFSIPTLYRKNLYFGWNELNKIFEPNSNNSVDFNQYKDILMDNSSKNFKEVKNDYKKFSYKQFNPLFSKAGKEFIEIKNENGTLRNLKCDKYSFNVDLNQFIDIYSEFISKISEDKNLKALAEEKVTKLLDLVEKNNDYKKFDINKEDANDLKSNFDKYYDEFIKEIKKDAKDLEKDTKKSSNLAISSEIFFDSKDLLRGLTNEIKIDADHDSKFTIINTNVINSANEKLTIDSAPTSNVLDVGKMTKDEIEDLMDEIEESFNDIFDTIL